MPRPAILSRIATATASPAVPDADPQLLRRFLATRCDEAFTELVRRHGPMVLATCRRVLGQPEDAEDAFQGTFVVLARKAGTVRGTNLAGWLYGVAVRTAREVRIMRDRRRKHESVVANGVRPPSEPACVGVDTSGPAEDRELVAVIDEELARLPERYRLPVVLCELQGCSRKDTAVALGIPEGTLSSRLAAARRKLADQLTRRGVATTAAAVTAVFAQHAVARVPGELARAAIGTAPPSTVAVVAADGVVKALFVARLKGVVVAVGLVWAGLVGGSLGIGWASATPRAAVADATTRAEVVPEGVRPVREAEPEARESRIWHLPRGNPAQTGATDETLPDTLAVQWTYRAGDGILGSPCVAAGLVFVATEDGDVHAIDLKTGKRKWKTTLGPTKASVAYRQDRVYVGTEEGKFFCLNAATGKVVWAFDTGGEITAAANFYAGLVLIPSHAGTLFALDAAGRKVWELATPDPIYGSVAVVAGTAYVTGCDKTLHILNAASGKETGRADLSGQTGASPAVVGTRLYVGTMDGEVLAIDLTRRKRAWAFKTPRSDMIRASTAVTDHLVIAIDAKGLVQAVDRTTGRAKWDFVAGRGAEGSPVVAGSHVLVPANDAVLYVLDLETGKTIQEITLDAGILGSPAVVDGGVVAATMKGTVYRLGADSR